MFSKLFHSDVFIPKGVSQSCINLQKKITHYYFSKHFEEHIKNQLVEDRSHTYMIDVITKCLDSLKQTQQPVFEVELSKDYHYFKVRGWVITKYCCRIPYNNSQDLVVAIRPQYNNLTVKDNFIVTAWMNSKTDNHKTLDTSKYCSKTDWDNNFKDIIQEVK